MLALASSMPARAWMVTRPATPGEVGAFGHDVLIDAAGDVVVAGDGSNVIPLANGGVTKLAGSDGTPLWTTGSALASPRLLLHSSGDVLLVGLDDVELSSLPVAFGRLDGTTGLQVWYEEIPVPVSALDNFEPARPVLTPDGNILTAVNPGRIGAPSVVMVVDPADGSLVWSHELADWFDPAVAVDANGDVLVSGWEITSGDTLAARLAAADGSEIWTRTIPSSAVPVVFDRRQSAVVGHPDGDAVVGNATVDGGSSAVFKLAAADGSDVWRFDAAENRGMDLLVAAGGDVIARLGAFDDTRVARLDAATGTAVWSVVPALRTSHVGLRPDGDLVALGHGGTFFERTALIQRLAIASGASVWQLVPSGAPFGTTAAATADGAVALTGAWDLPGSGTIGSFAQLVSTRVSGRKLVVRQDVVTPQRNRLVLTSKDKRMMVPAPGSAEDPSSAGGEIVVQNPDTAESVSFVLPAANWVAKAIDPAGNGTSYRYADSSGACPRVLLRSGRIKLKCVGPLMNFTLDEAQQGALRVILRLGTAPDYCFEFGGAVIRDEGAVTGGVFKAKDAGAPGDCPGGL